VYQDLVVADYLDFAAEMKGLAAADKTRELRRVVEATEIGDKLLAPISTLSRGYKQRVGVAQAILARPRLLILDEPTNGLDPTQTEHMRSLIRELSAEATVILSTHIMQEVEALCDRALILRAGELVVDARLEELRQADAVLVSASAGADLGAALASLDGITAVEPVAAAEDEQRLRLRLDASTEPRRACAAVAAAVQAAGAALYSLGVERRDLETLFREVNRAGAAEVRHAA
jgi:ABC-2 type transport system ATP-binding protein